MKKYLNFFLCAITIALFSCSKEDENKLYEDELSRTAWHEEDGEVGDTYTLYLGVDRSCTLVWHAYLGDIDKKCSYFYQHPEIKIGFTNGVKDIGIVDDSLQTITLTIDSDIHILKRFR